MSDDEKGPDVRPRPSASLDASRAAERARLRAMTARERMALALELGLRCRAIEGAAEKAKP